MDNMSKQLHGNLVGTFAEVYEGRTALTLLYATILGIIAEAFGSMKPSAFAGWVAEEFGTGGKTSAEGYKVGRLPVALRSKGYMSEGAKRGEGDAMDSARVNTLVSQTRIIAKAKADDPTFDLDRTFNACYVAARGDGKGSNRSKKSASKKSGKVTTIKVEDVPAEIAAAWIEAHLATACEAIVNVLRRRKDTIRLPMMEQVRAGLVANK